MKYLTVEQAATRANISARTLFRRMKEPNGPRVTRIGPKRTLIAVTDLESWLSRCAD